LHLISDPFSNAGTKLVNQSLEPLYYLAKDENGALIVTFAEKFTNRIRFQTFISCDGCPDDEAFASEYPESFGNYSEGAFHRDLLLDSRSTIPLNAGFVVIAIEKKFSYFIPNIGRVGEATVLAQQQGPIKLMRSYNYKEVVSSNDYSDLVHASFISCIGIIFSTHR
jgi:hypothetical protein